MVNKNIPSIFRRITLNVFLYYRVLYKKAPSFGRRMKKVVDIE